MGNHQIGFVDGDLAVRPEQEDVGVSASRAPAVGRFPPCGHLGVLGQPQPLVRRDRRGTVRADDLVVVIRLPRWPNGAREDLARRSVDDEALPRELVAQAGQGLAEVPHVCAEGDPRYGCRWRRRQS